MTDREKKATKKAGARTGPGAEKADGEAAVLTEIAAMPALYRAMGERLHALILRSASALQPTLWYGMSAYAKGGKVICVFRADRYMTFGLTDKANHALEETRRISSVNPQFFTTLDDATEGKLCAIVRRAAS